MEILEVKVDTNDDEVIEALDPFEEAVSELRIVDVTDDNVLDAEDDEVAEFELELDAEDTVELIDDSVVEEVKELKIVDDR